MNADVELNTENRTFLIPVHSFKRKPTEVLFILNIKIQVSKNTFISFKPRLIQIGKNLIKNVLKGAKLQKDGSLTHRVFHS